MRRVEVDGFTSEDIIEAFNVAQSESKYYEHQNNNNNEKGQIHMDDIIKFLTTPSDGDERDEKDDDDDDNKPLTEERARELAMHLERNNDGFVDYEELVGMMMNW